MLQRDGCKLEIWVVRCTQCLGSKGLQTYSINEGRRIHQQPWHETMFVTCHAVESSSKNQVTHNVVVQISRPLGEIERLRPLVMPVFLPSGRCLWPFLDDVAESVDIGDNEILCWPQSLLSESMLHDTPMRGMHASVNLRVDAICSSWGFNDAIPWRLPDVTFAIGINLLHRPNRIEWQCIRTNANNRACSTLGSTVTHEVRSKVSPYHTSRVISADQGVGLRLKCDRQVPSL